MPYSSQALDADRENGPAARSFGADAHDRIMVRIKRSYRIQVCGTKMRPQWRAPLGSLNRPTDRHRSDTEAMPKARLAVHRRSACSGVKALRNTSHARRQAAKLCYRFGPLTPSARSGDLIAGDGTKNGLSRSEQKTVSTTQNNRLTGKAPYKFESISLHRRVCCEPDSHAVGLPLRQQRDQTQGTGRFTRVAGTEEETRRCGGGTRSPARPGAPPCRQTGACTR